MNAQRLFVLSGLTLSFLFAESAQAAADPAPAPAAPAAEADKQAAPQQAPEQPPAATPAPAAAPEATPATAPAASTATAEPAPAGQAAPAPTAAPPQPAATESAVAPEAQPAAPAAAETTAAEPAAEQAATSPTGAPPAAAPSDVTLADDAGAGVAPADEGEAQAELRSTAASSGKSKKGRRPFVRKASDRSRIERKPFYIGLGIGYGFSGLAADAGFGGTPMAASLGIRLGAVIRDQWAVGVSASLLGQFNEWAEDTATGAAMSSVLGEFTAFPIAYMPLNFTVGAGWASAATLERRGDIRADGADDEPRPLPVPRWGDGPQWLAAAGWDFFPGRGGNLGVQLRYEGISAGNLGVSHSGMLAIWVNFY